MRNLRFVLFAAVALAVAIMVGLAIRPAPAEPRVVPVAPVTPVAAVAPVADVAEHASTDHGPDSAQRMSPSELSRLLARGEALVLDVREADAYLAGHIDGAVHIPLSFIESELPYLRRGKRIVAYCT